MTENLKALTQLLYEAACVYGIKPEMWADFLAAHGVLVVGVLTDEQICDITSLAPQTGYGGPGRGPPDSDDRAGAAVSRASLLSIAKGES